MVVASQSDPRALTLHPDRLFPVEASTRALARELYQEVRELPIISPHGHVPISWIADDLPFTDPTSLLISPDHYVTRMLHANGVPLTDLGVGQGPLTDEASRAAFGRLCEHWSDFRGTPVRYWFENQLVDIFGVDLVPSAQTADQIHDAIAATIADPSFRPRALMERFGIQFLATTDDPCDDLADHARVASDDSFAPRVAPTFRPDRYLEPGRADWNELTDNLAQASGVEIGDWDGWVAAMENRRAHFKAHGAISTDHSHLDLGTQTLEPAELARLFSTARAGAIDQVDADRLRRHMVTEMARMACDDGLTMTLHPGVARNHHTPTFERYGTDVGCDIPVQIEATRALQPLLNRYGTHPNLNLVLFTLDETVFSREYAPLAGFYPSVYVGAPWWFIDSPEAIRRFRRATTETAGFSRTSGFIDDTRAFCSIPARHDMARRLDCGFLAELVADHRLTESEAAESAVQLVVHQPTRVFKL